MSKRNSISSSASPASTKNTLFKYFAQSPKPVKKEVSSELNNEPKPQESSEPGCSSPKKTKKDKVDTEVIPNSNKRELEVKSVDNSDDDDIPLASHAKKRRRIIVNSDSDTENESSKLNASNHTPKKEKHKVSLKFSPKPAVKTTEKQTAKSSFEEKLKLSQNSNDKKNEKILKDLDKTVLEEHDIDDTINYKHNNLPFLQPDKIKDKNGRRPADPDYDPTTLYIPKKFLDELTPGVRQWWEFKINHFDCVLFFKVGKFYEFYHMDADIGVKELGFNYMRGDFAHSGFPEISFDKMSSTLIERGYKIARVEQTETPDMMTERVKKLPKATKFDKVVRREICQITNRGTKVFGSQTEIGYDHNPNYMLAISEKDDGVSSTYGICFIDTSIGDFHLGQFKDDKNCSRLLTLISHNCPVLLLYDKISTTPRTQQIYRTILKVALKEHLFNEKQFWTAEKTLKFLAENYFSLETENKWPSVIKSMQDDKDHLGLTPKKDYGLALKSLGACIWYMKDCLLDQQVLSMARYFNYIPPDIIETNTNALIENATNQAAKKSTTRHMVLDSITLSNLKITGSNSLFTTLDFCCTKFGKRLLHYWIVTPSCDVNVIRSRQEGIAELMENSTVFQELRSLLGSLSDMERLLAQIHGFGNKKKMHNHPDGRAVLFEEKQYNKKKIQNFVSIINSLESLLVIPNMFKDFQSPIIKNLTQKEPVGKFPNLKEILTFKEAFDHDEALKTGVIAPKVGIDKEYDKTEDAIESIKQELKDYLNEQEKFFKCRLSYFGTDKKRFQIEVPEKNAKKAGDEYCLESQRKGKDPVRRFHTQETRNFLKRMINAETARNNVLKDLSRRVFEKFSNHIDLWKQCIQNIAIIDVLTSLASYAKNQNQICIPQIFDECDSPFIQIEEGFHPCVPSESFIPNGIELGGSDNKAAVSLLTGPNMGGKSTLMREVGLLAIMAQIGCHVPANSCQMSVVDRIFTRLGAHDDILAGHSTFLVELNETSAIIKHATKNSLVLLDELGRGTATYDGTAIAASVLQYLSQVRCRTLFSTHYHNLVDYFQKNKNVTLGHMACMVENEDNDDPTEETVTFLYKYSDGACPKSYGFNAAKLAGMPRLIIKRAHELSKVMEGNALQRRIISKCFVNQNVSEIKNLLKQLKLYKT